MDANPWDKSRHEDAAHASQSSGGLTDCRARELTWALLDDMISAEEMAALDGLLQTEPAARGEYLRCVRLHADLYSEFTAKPASSEQPNSARLPVLGFLHSESQPFGLPSTPADDAKP